jgi:stearoyl-CoA 9-desaturase NADPH oxidoreductase
MVAAVSVVRSPRARVHRGVRRVLESRVVGALASPHDIDDYLVIAGARWATADPPARIVGVAHATPGTVTLTVRPGPGWRPHAPGQHVALTVPLGGARRTRCFSIASSPHRPDGLVELTVKATGGGGVSDHLVQRAQPGDAIELAGPSGEFVLPADRPPHVVLVSGGSGITPLLSMLRTLADEVHGGEVSFLHYARTPEDVIAAPDLAAIRARRPDWRIVVAHTGPTGLRNGRAPAGAPSGRFRPDHLDALLPGATDAPVWVCGPSGLDAAVEDAWRAAGSGAPVHVERYRLGPIAPVDTGALVRFTAAGLEVRDDGRPLLVQAEAAGLAPAFGCRAGQCHTCIRRKPAGAVRDVRTDDVTDEPDALVQLCVSVPAGHVEIDL